MKKLKTIIKKQPFKFMCLMCLFFVFISAMLLCFIPTSKRNVKAETFSFETDIINKWGNWEFNENNAVATNANSGNEFIVTKHNATKQQEVVMKADVSFTTGAGTGFAFGMPDNNDPGKSWYSLNLFRDSDTAIYLRFFAVNVANSIGDTHNFRYDLSQDETSKNLFSIELRISNGGTLKGFLNGKCVVSVHDTGYQGGYLGFLTYFSSVTYNNVEVSVFDAPENNDNTIDEQGFSHINPSKDIKNQWGEWYKDSEKFTANNLVWWNQFAMTDINVKPNQDLVFEADLTRLSNSNCAMIVFGVEDRNDPGRGWYAVNLQEVDGRIMTRLYESNRGSIGEDLNFHKKDLTDEETKNKTHNLRIEAFADGKLCAYFDGIRFIETFDSFYTGGYIGFGTFYGAYMFENIKYKISESGGNYCTDGEKTYNTTDFRSKYNWENWTYSDNTVVANNAASGNLFSMSTLYVRPDQNFSLQADVLMNGNSAAIAFGISQINDPIKGWYALAISKQNKNARLFSESKGSIGTASKHVIDLTQSQLENTFITLRIEAYASGLIKAWVDGTQICDVIDPEWNGGYIGFNTFFADATFKNIKYAIYNNSSLLSGLELEGYDINFDANKKGYILEVPTHTQKLKIKAKAKDNYTIQINNQTADTLDYQITKAISIVEVGVLDSLGNTIGKYDIEIKRFFNEQYRPSYHFTEKETWINDPNGLVYDATTGTYHMFYQYCEGVNNDGVFYWGHAVSDNLIDWQRKQPAIAPDQNGIIFSGSCIIDEDNDSGLFNDDIPKASRLIAFFTYHSDNPSIGMAYSLDFGETWIKYGKVITNADNVYGNQFRDPKVVRVENEWLMITGGWTNVRLFSSSNLTDWSFNSEVYDFLNKNLQSECPDIFPLSVDNDENNKKWVISTGGTSYIVGSLDKINDKFVFTAQTPGFKMFNSPDLWTNCGEVYATQSYYNDKDGRRILVSWMVDRTANAIEGKWWNGAQSLPLQTDLITKNGMIVMRGYPVTETHSLRQEEILKLNDVVLTHTDNPLDNIQSNAFDMEAEIEVGTAKTITFEFCKGENEKTTIIYDVENRVLTLNALSSGQVVKYILNASLTPIDGKISLRLLFDKSIIEVFANKGEQSYHAFIFPSENSTSMSIKCDGGNAKIISMSIWNTRDIHSGGKT